MAEREGFEPSIRTFEPYAGLANRCLQPLGHVSRSCECACGGTVLASRRTGSMLVPGGGEVNGAGGLHEGGCWGGVVGERVRAAASRALPPSPRDPHAGTA